MGWTKTLAGGCLLGAMGLVVYPGVGAQEGNEDQQRPSGDSYFPVKDMDFQEVLEKDRAEKDEVMERQRELLEERYDLSDRPSDVMMSGGRKAVQEGVRVKLPDGVDSWDELNAMSPEEIREKDLFPKGFMPLPHAKHQTGGMVFPEDQIDAIEEAEQRDLARFDVEFDLPEHLLPEYPPPLFLTNRPDLGDVSDGEVITLKNFQDKLKGVMTPVQLEGMRLLLTPFPQQQFNATHDRKVREPSEGVTCLDCHVNGHTNAAFHLNPDTRPNEARLRIDTVSLRGMFNQQIHGSKRSLRSVEDFTEFEQRTAYFDGDQVTAAKKGINVLERGGQVSAMAQAQNMFDFPPAPKLKPNGDLDPNKATQQELLGEKIFRGKGQCADCHSGDSFMDNEMADLEVDRFYEPREINGRYTQATGPIKNFTLRGIKDSPPYLHDGRLLTLEDTVEFFNLVLQLDLDQEEKDALVAYMRVL
ncbi:MAG: cytochrome B6 [Thiohalorhabdus sp.]